MTDENDWPLNRSKLIAAFKVTDIDVFHHTGDKNSYYQISVSGFILDCVGGVLFSGVQESAAEGDVERVVMLERLYSPGAILWLESDHFFYDDESIDIYNPKACPVPEEQYDTINEFFPRRIETVDASERLGKKIFFGGIYVAGRGQLHVYCRPRIPPLPDDFFDDYVNRL